MHNQSGVREFRQEISTFLEADTPVAVTRLAETLGVYVLTRGKRTETTELSALRSAPDLLS